MDYVFRIAAQYTLWLIELIIVAYELSSSHFKPAVDGFQC